MTKATIQRVLGLILVSKLLYIITVEVLFRFLFSKMLQIIYHLLFGYDENISFLLK